MEQRSIKLFLAMSMLVLPFRAFSEVNDPEVTKSKCKKFCSIIAGTACIGNLNADTFTLAGVPLNSLTTIATILNAGNPLVRSVVPFSSGLLTLAAVPTFPALLNIPTTGFVMGFGSNSLFSSGSPVPDISSDTAFSFSVPEAGTIYNLRVSVDSLFLIAGTFTYTFTVLQSPCVNGSTPSAYTVTTLTATATTTAAAIGQGTTGCGSNTSVSIPVAAGDRITILVTPNAVVPATTVVNAAFSAGFDYAPTL